MASSTSCSSWLGPSASPSELLAGLAQERAEDAQEVLLLERLGLGAHFVLVGLELLASLEQAAIDVVHTPPPCASRGIDWVGSQVPCQARTGRSGRVGRLPTANRASMPARLRLCWRSRLRHPGLLSAG